VSELGEIGINLGVLAVDFGLLGNGCSLVNMTDVS
jgi:hypothetical protein